MFVLAEKTPEDYNIRGVFKSLDKACEAIKEDETIQTNIKNLRLQIDEIPIDSVLKYNPSVGKSHWIIAGAINSYDVKGIPLNS